MNNPTRTAPLKNPVQTPEIDGAVCGRVDSVVRFLSFGAGVQSSVMLMLAIRGELERPDYVIWADTGFEPRLVYEHIDWAEKQCQQAGLPFQRVRAKMTLREEFVAFESGAKKHWNSRPPLFPAGAAGPLNRQCTREVKILPLLREEKRLMGYTTARGIPDDAAVVQIGISTDEARRAAPSPDAWYDCDYPLIDPLKMSRNDCRAWWNREFPHVHLPSSSCTICPYKTSSMWRAMRETAPDDFAEAVEYDERIRTAYQRKTNETLFLTREKRPLVEVAADTGQQSLDLDDEVYCSGGCGL